MLKYLKEYIVVPRSIWGKNTKLYTKELLKELKEKTPFYASK